MKKIFILSLLLISPKLSFAHCPLCTAGAGALAVLAASVGVSSVVVGLTIGAFALSLATWTSKIIKRKFFFLQDFLVAVVVFLSVVIPISPLIREYDPLYISLWGDYGTMFHNTYTMNLFFLGLLIGVLVVLTSPYLSRLLSKIRGGKIIPYQGVTLTLFLVLLFSILIQIIST